MLHYSQDPTKELHSNLSK